MKRLIISSILNVGSLLVASSTSQPLRNVFAPATRSAAVERTQAPTNLAVPSLKVPACRGLVRLEDATLVLGTPLTTDLIAKTHEYEERAHEEREAALIRTTSKCDSISEPGLNNAVPHNEPHTKQYCTGDIEALARAQYQTPTLMSKKISLHVQEAPIDEVIEKIQALAHINISLHSSISGTLRGIHGDDIPLGRALSMICNALAPRCVFIAHPSSDTYELLPYAQAFEILDARAQALRAKSYRHCTIRMNHCSLSKDRIAHITAYWNHLTRTHAGVSESLSQLLCDRESSTITAYGSHSCIEALKKYLAHIDIAAPQVKIEARVVIACRDFEDSYGLQWSNIFNRRSSICNGFEFVGSGPLENIRNCPEPQTKCNLFDWALNLFPAAGLASRTVDIPFVFGGNDLNTKRLNIVLNAAENRGDAKTILKPSLLASNGEEAEILVGSRIPIQTIIRETIEGNLRDVTTATYVDVGTKLRVTPTVSPDKKSVYLDLYVENSCVEGCSERFPLIRTTRSHNRVVLQNNQTTLISGLLEHNKRTERNAIPFLSEVPLLGALFQGNRKLQKDAQLLIFLTPTIVSTLG